MKVDQSTQKPEVRPIARYRRPICVPLTANLDFKGGAALQQVGEWVI